MAQLLIESMESEWDPERFHDTHREKVEAIIEEKRQGHEIVLQEGPEPAAKVVDLMEALNASIAAAAKPGSEGKTTKRPAAKRTAAKRAAPAKKAGQDHQGTRPDQDRRPTQGVLSASIAVAAVPAGSPHLAPGAASTGVHSPRLGQQFLEAVTQRPQLTFQLLAALAPDAWPPPGPARGRPVAAWPATAGGTRARTGDPCLRTYVRLQRHTRAAMDPCRPEARARA